MNKTTNYQLNQWDATDQVKRTDFNEDNAKIDGLLAQKCEAVFGTYAGNGAAQRNINLGRKPKAVLLFSSYGRTYSSNFSYGGLALPGAPVKYDSTHPVLTVTDTGFTVYETRISSSSAVSANGSPVTYHYIAFF